MAFFLNPYLYIWFSLIVFLAFSARVVLPKILMIIDANIGDLKRIEDDRALQREALTQELKAMLAKQDALDQEIKDIINQARLKAQEHYEMVREKTVIEIEKKQEQFNRLCESIEAKLERELLEFASVEIRNRLVEHYTYMSDQQKQDLIKASLKILK